MKPATKKAGQANLADKAVSNLSRIDARQKMKKSDYSPNSKFAPAGHRRISVNLKTETYEALRMLATTNRKTAGIIIEELITKYGDKVKAYKHPIEDAK